MECFKVMSEIISLENKGGYLEGWLRVVNVGMCWGIYVEKTSLMVRAFVLTEVLCKRDEKSIEQKSP